MKAPVRADGGGDDLDLPPFRNREQGWPTRSLCHCSRAYYAMHDAAHAALISSGYETPAGPIKTHHTLIAEFGINLVQGGHLDAALGRAFNKVHDTRQLADYSAEPPALVDAEWAVEQAGIFVTAIRMTLFSTP